MIETAHDVLGLDPAATPEQIRDRYLELVRQNPPEQAPERFAAIRAAYTHLQDPDRQLSQMLNHPYPADGIDRLAAEIEATLPRPRLRLAELIKASEATS